MSVQDNSVGNFPISEDEISGGMLNIFSPPEKHHSILSGKETEIRLFTVLERFVAWAYY